MSDIPLARRSWRKRLDRSMSVALISATIASGCGTVYPRYLGVRPDVEDRQLSERKKEWCETLHTQNAPLIAACRRYWGNVEWANQLLESYKTRATMNQWAIYVAGTIALGALAAIGGLGIAAAAATETIGLIGVSSGFASGFFAMLNNNERGALYTEAGTEIIDGLKAARQKVEIPNPTLDQYVEAITVLASHVDRADVAVEKGRHSLAAAAAASPERQKALEDVTEFQRLAAEGALVGITPASTPRAGGDVELALAGVKVDKYKERIKVYVDGTITASDPVAGKENTLKVKIPAAASGQTFANVRVQVGPVTLQGERQQPYR